MKGRLYIKDCIYRIVQIADRHMQGQILKLKKMMLKKQVLWTHQENYSVVEEIFDILIF